MGTHRAEDAAQLQQHGRQLAALYFIGYFVECQAKALCLAAGKTPPTGHDGHNLALLIERAGLHISDLHPDQRSFAQDHRVAIRYEEALPADIDYLTSYGAAASLGGLLRIRVQRQARRRRKK